jgi:hypothetical protein
VQRSKYNNQLEEGKMWTKMESPLTLRFGDSPF